MAKDANKNNEIQAQMIAAALFGQDQFAQKKNKHAQSLQPNDNRHPVAEVFHRTVKSDDGRSWPMVQINFKTEQARQSYMQVLRTQGIQCDNGDWGWKTTVPTQDNGSAYGLQVPCQGFLNDSGKRQQFLGATTNSPQGALSQYIATREEEAGITQADQFTGKSHKKTVFGSYNAGEKINAATAFQDYLSGELTPADLTNHTGALTQGRLWKQVVKPYLESQGIKNPKKSDLSQLPLQVTGKNITMHRLVLNGGKTNNKANATTFLNEMLALQKKYQARGMQMPKMLLPFSANYGHTESFNQLKEKYSSYDKSFGILQENDGYQADYFKAMKKLLENGRYQSLRDKMVMVPVHTINKDRNSLSKQEQQSALNNLCEAQRENPAALIAVNLDAAKPDLTAERTIGGAYADTFDSYIGSIRQQFNQCMANGPANRAQQPQQQEGAQNAQQEKSQPQPAAEQPAVPPPKQQAGAQNAQQGKSQPQPAAEQPAVPPAPTNENILTKLWESARGLSVSESKKNFVITLNSSEEADRFISLMEQTGVAKQHPGVIKFFCDKEGDRVAINMSNIRTDDNLNILTTAISSAESGLLAQPVAPPAYSSAADAAPKTADNNNSIQASMIAEALFGQDQFEQKENDFAQSLQPNDQKHPVAEVFHRTVKGSRGRSWPMVQINFKTQQARESYMQVLRTQGIQCDKKDWGWKTTVPTQDNGGTYGLQVPCMSFLNVPHRRKQFLDTTRSYMQSQLAQQQSSAQLPQQQNPPLQQATTSGHRDYLLAKGLGCNDPVTNIRGVVYHGKSGMSVFRRTIQPGQGQVYQFNFTNKHLAQVFSRTMHAKGYVFTKPHSESGNPWNIQINADFVDRNRISFTAAAQKAVIEGITRAVANASGCDNPDRNPTYSKTSFHGSGRQVFYREADQEQPAVIQFNFTDPNEARSFYVTHKGYAQDCVRPVAGSNKFQVQLNFDKLSNDLEPFVKSENAIRKNPNLRQASGQKPPVPAASQKGEYQFQFSGRVVHYAQSHMDQLTQGQRNLLNGLVSKVGISGLSAVDKIKHNLDNEKAWDTGIREDPHVKKYLETQNQQSSGSSKGASWRSEGKQDTQQQAQKQELQPPSLSNNKPPPKDPGP